MPPVESSQAFFNNRYKEFENIFQDDPENHIYLELAGFVIDLQFADYDLIPDVIFSLSHMIIEVPRRIDLQICIIMGDKRSFVGFPVPWNLDHPSSKNGILFHSKGSILIGFREKYRTFHMLDISKSLGIYWISDSKQIPPTLFLNPFLMIFNWWMSYQNHLLVHAAAVGFETGGVIITGKSGSGKSTSALACLRSELKFLSDDHCIISENHPYLVSGIYNTVKIDKNMVEQLPYNKYDFDKRQLLEDKEVLSPGKKHPDKLIKKFSLKAILVPHITHQQDTNTMRISHVAALTAMSPTTLFQLPNRRQNLFKRLSQLCKSIPTYALQLGIDLDQIPEVVIDILELEDIH